LAVDYGTKRIGLAISDGRGVIASPLTTVSARGSLVEQVETVVDAVHEFDVDALVVGLPVNMDDTEGGQAAITRRYGGALGTRFGKPVHYFDERLSTVAADEMLRPAELTRKKRKARTDAVAAQVILQSFLDGQRG